MIEQAIGREAHQQTKALEQYLIYENLVNQELVRKKCKDELIQEFLGKLKDTYKVNGDLMKILDEAKSQTNLN